MAKRNLIFWSKSKDSDIGCEYKNWGKILSNFYEQEIVINCYTWPTVEHYFQASKFMWKAKEGDRRYSEYVKKFMKGGEFSLEEHKGQMGKLARKMGGKTATKKTKKFEGFDIDPKWDQIKITIMKAALLERVRQHPEVVTILTNVQKNNINLVHYERSGHFWGAKIKKSDNGEETIVGKNVLGNLYMELLQIIK